MRGKLSLKMDKYSVINRLYFSQCSTKVKTLCLTKTNFTNAITCFFGSLYVLVNYKLVQKSQIKEIEYSKSSN